MMRTVTTTAAAALLLTLTACGTTDEPDPGHEAEEDGGISYDESLEEEPLEEEGDYGPVTVGLDEEHDFGDGFTIQLTDIERRVAEDGFNSTTGEEGALPYFAWTVEITNGTEQTVPTGYITQSCSVGDPLMESEGPVLGESINPPESLAPGQSGAWEEDCWADEEDSQLQWTVTFHDEESGELYPSVTFAGEVA